MPRKRGGSAKLPGAAGNLGVQFVHALHQGLNGGGVGGVHKDCRRGVLGDFDSSGTTVVTASTFAA